MDAATAHDGEDVAPKPGDVGVCFECTGIIVYGDDGIPRQPREEELAAAQADPIVQTTISKIKEFRKRVPRQ